MNYEVGCILSVSVESRAPRALEETVFSIHKGQRCLNGTSRAANARHVHTKPGQSLSQVLDDGTRT